MLQNTGSSVQKNKAPHLSKYVEFFLYFNVSYFRMPWWDLHDFLQVL